jgi:hypothetical protein
MSDDLNALGDIGRAMSVMKMKPVRLPGIQHRDPTGQLAIMIAREQNWFRDLRDPSDQLTQFDGGSFVVHEVAQEDEVLRLIILYQFDEPFFDRRHPPHRHEPSRRALA